MFSAKLQKSFIVIRQGLFTTFTKDAGPASKALGNRRAFDHVSVMEKTIAMSMVFVFATFCGAYALHVWKR
jgi:hypothetical protein